MLDSIFYILIFVVGLFFILISKKIAISLDIVDRPNSSIKTHTKTTPYLGGLGIIATLFFGIFLFREELEFSSKFIVELGSILLIFILGFLDDKYNLSVLLRLITQFIITISLISVGNILIFTNNFYIDFIVTIIGIIFMINAMNILDILDGLSSGITIIILLSLILILSNFNETTYLLFSTIYIVALLSFLVFNFNPASIFMGDSGSTVLGLVIAIVFINTYNQSDEISHKLSSLIALSVPIFEVIYVSILRLKKGMSPMKGSKDHFALRKRIMGHSVKESVLLSYGVTFLTLITSYIVYDLSLTKAVIVTFGVIMSFSIFGYILSKVKID